MQKAPGIRGPGYGITVKGRDCVNSRDEDTADAKSGSTMCCVSVLGASFCEL